VTGEKALYVNPQFTRFIVGYKKEESDALLKFLYDHIALSQDIQARVRWRAGTVVVWDVSSFSGFLSIGLLFCIVADSYRTVWRATLPFSIGRMVSVGILPVLRRRQSLLMRRLLRRRNKGWMGG
jgi:hypothetical protein